MGSGFILRSLYLEGALVFHFDTRIKDTPFESPLNYQKKSFQSILGLEVVQDRTKYNQYDTFMQC